YLGVAVPDGGRPQRGDAVEVAAAVDVDQPGPPGAVDDGRFVVDPAGVLGERVPDVGDRAGGPGGAGGHRRLLLDVLHKSVWKVPPRTGGVGPGLLHCAGLREPASRRDEYTSGSKGLLTVFRALHGLRLLTGHRASAKL